MSSQLSHWSWLSQWQDMCTRGENAICKSNRKRMSCTSTTAKPAILTWRFHCLNTLEWFNRLCLPCLSLRKSSCSGLLRTLSSLHCIPSRPVCWLALLLPQMYSNLRVMNPDEDDDYVPTKEGYEKSFEVKRDSSPGWRRGSFDDDWKGFERL